MADHVLDLDRERAMEGLKAALAIGRRAGRPRKLSDADFRRGARAVPTDAINPVAAIAKRLGVRGVMFRENFAAARRRLLEAV